MFPIKKIIINSFKAIKQKLKQLVALRASKHQISLGVGVGVFIGVFPTFGLGAIAIALIAPFLKFNIPAALIGTLVANPFTMPLWVFLSCWIVGLDSSAINVTELTIFQAFRHLSGVLLTYLIGVLIISTFSGIVSYIFTRSFLHFYSKRKKRLLKDKTAELSQ